MCELTVTCNLPNSLKAPMFMQTATA